MTKEQFKKYMGIIHKRYDTLEMLYGDESDMYEHLVGIIGQWRKWKEMDKNNVIK